MATDSSVLAWRLPWTEEPGGLQSMGSQSRTGLKQLSRHVFRPDTAGRRKHSFVLLQVSSQVEAAVVKTPSQFQRNCLSVKLLENIFFLCGILMQCNALGFLQIKTSTRLQKEFCLSGSLTNVYGLRCQNKTQHENVCQQRDLGSLESPFQNLNSGNLGDKVCIILSQGARTAKDNFHFTVMV